MSGDADTTDDDELHMQLLAEYETSVMPDPPVVMTLNHGGPGICTLCYPGGAPKPRQAMQQEELAL